MTKRGKPAPNDAQIDEALAAWRQGDWPALAALAEAPLDASEARGRLAALAAAGLSKAGRIDAARGWLAQALAWGCPHRFASDAMLSAAHATLGRGAILFADEARARRHLTEAVALAGDSTDQNPEIIARLHGAVEKARLGQFEDALTDVNGAHKVALHRGALTSVQGRVFDSQIKLLNHVVAMALSRGQLSAGTGAQDEAASLESRSVSQLGQDLWVLEQTGMKRGGFFVEFGATDGIILSNSFLLEKEFGWSGICAEPNPKFYERLVQNRSCTCAPDCIMGETGQTVEFILADEYGGVADHADGDSHSDKRKAFADMGEVLTLTTISLDEFLEKYDAPRTIDYMSIDTEGSEYEILKTFPFEKWDIRYLTIEHNFADIRPDIQALLAKHGYRCIESRWDDWFVKEDG